MTPRASGLLSVVVPVLNEEDNIPELIRRLKAALDGGLPFEIVFVDDGSTDRTWRLPASLAAAGPRAQVGRTAGRHRRRRRRDGRRPAGRARSGAGIREALARRRRRGVRDPPVAAGTVGHTWRLPRVLSPAGADQRRRPPARQRRLLADGPARRR